MAIPWPSSAPLPFHLLSILLMLAGSLLLLGQKPSGNPCRSPNSLLKTTAVEPHTGLGTRRMRITVAWTVFAHSASIASGDTQRLKDRK